MIRPLTCVCMLLAGGSGLYLYQSKHRAQMLDREIVRTLKATDAARDRIGVLRGEWAQLNEPDRLSTLSHAHLSLKTLQPAQFVAIADLGARLPQVGAATVPADEPVAGAEPAMQKPAAPPTPAPVQVAARPTPPPQRPARPAQVASGPQATVVQVGATAIGAPAASSQGMSIGESVARMARLRAGQGDAGASSPISAHAPYSAPPYNPPPYSAPIYSQAVASALGGSRASLPPPVPFGSAMASSAR